MVGSAKSTAIDTSHVPIEREHSTARHGRPAAVRTCVLINTTTTAPDTSAEEGGRATQLSTVHDPTTRGQGEETRPMG